MASGPSDGHDNDFDEGGIDDQVAARINGLRDFRGHEHGREGWLDAERRRLRARSAGVRDRGRAWCANDGETDEGIGSVRVAQKSRGDRDDGKRGEDGNPRER